MESPGAWLWRPDTSACHCWRKRESSSSIRTGTILSRSSGGGDGVESREV